MSRYPTPEKIMAVPVNFKPETIEDVKVWAKKYLHGWKTQQIGYKRIALVALIQGLSNVYNKPCNSITSDEYAYDPESQTIHLDEDKASILSTLHEFGHHLYGASELKACRWSIQLFKICFPKTFESLEWEGHMLKQKPSE